MALDFLITSFNTFSAGVGAMTWYWKAWIYLMILVNGLCPLIFLPRFSAIIVLVSALSGLISGIILTGALGYTKILGLMHFSWIPMVCYQIYYFKKNNLALSSLHDYWLMTSLVISVLSLVLDFSDIYQYISKVKV